jgi:hypothetical protein
MVEELKTIWDDDNGLDDKSPEKISRVLEKYFGKREE